MPRHSRSGWHRMWPNSAFHDVKVFPHSVHGGIGSVVVYKVFCLFEAGSEEEARLVVSIRRGVERRRLWREVVAVAEGGDEVFGVVGGRNGSCN